MATPNAISAAGSAALANSMPKTPIPTAPRQTCHLALMRSANSRHSNGPIGSAMAMIKAYSRLVVTLMPLAISNVGTQAAKPSNSRRSGKS